MSDWTIVVAGYGPDPVADGTNDIRKQTVDFVTSLRGSGHSVHHAAIVYGTLVEVPEGAKTGEAPPMVPNNELPPVVEGGIVPPYVPGNPSSKPGDEYEKPSLPEKPDDKPDIDVKPEPTHKKK